VAELELSSEDESFEMPEWAGQEVSGDPRYYNASLVKHPYCDW
jgi:adenylate cyclase